jgi:hypothetical protein
LRYYGAHQSKVVVRPRRLQDIAADAVQITSMQARAAPSVAANLTLTPQWSWVPALFDCSECSGHLASCAIAWHRQPSTLRRVGIPPRSDPTPSRSNAWNEWGIRFQVCGSRTATARIDTDRHVRSVDRGAEKRAPPARLDRRRCRADHRAIRCSTNADRVSLRECRSPWSGWRAHGIY